MRALGLWLLMGVVLLLPQPVFAQASHGLFSLPNPDKGISWITGLFPFDSGVDSTNPLAKLLGSALLLFNSGVLILASLLVGWLIINVVTDLAHQGRTLRYSDFWGPLRIVVALGFLIPIQHGYNAGQILTIKIAKMGSALATNIWQDVAAEISQANFFAAPPLELENEDFFKTVLLDDTCYYMLRGLSFDQPKIYGYRVGPVPLATGGYGYFFNRQDGINDSYCGNVILPKPLPPETLAGKIPDFRYTEAYNAAFRTALTKIDKIANEIMTAHIAAYKAGQNKADYKFTDLTVDQGRNWKSILSGFTQALQEKRQKSMDDIQQALAYEGRRGQDSEGWIKAGFWFIQNANISTQILKTMAVKPQAVGPADTILPPSLRADQTAVPCQGVYHDIWNNFECSDPGLIAQRGIESGARYVRDSTLASTSGPLPLTAFESPNSAVGTDHGIEQVLRKTFNRDFFASVTDTGAAGQSHLTDPFLKIITLGDNLMVASVSLMNIASGLGQRQLVASGMLGFFALALFPLGIILLMYLPLMPAIRFFMGVLTWLIAMFEAILAVPLLCLSQLQGQGKTTTGRSGYLILLQMLLRPALMVFGLIAGLLIFDIIALLLHSILFSAIIPIYNPQTLIGFMCLLGFLYVYVVLLYLVANLCFQTITLIPERMLEWLGPLQFSGAEPQALTPAGGGPGPGQSGSFGSAGFLPGAVTATIGGVTAPAPLMGGNATNMAAHVPASFQNTAARHDRKQIGETPTKATNLDHIPKAGGTLVAGGDTRGPTKSAPSTATPMALQPGMKLDKDKKEKEKEKKDAKTDDKEKKPEAKEEEAETEVEEVKKETEEPE